MKKQVEYEKKEFINIFEDKPINILHRGRPSMEGRPALQICNFNGIGLNIDRNCTAGVATYYLSMEFIELDVSTSYSL